MGLKDGIIGSYFLTLFYKFDNVNLCTTDRGPNFVYL